LRIRKVKADATIKGTITRPSYTGNITLWVYGNVSLRSAIYWMLKESSFPEIRIADIKINSSEVLEDHTSQEV
jgi:hypothetical protein